jgi:hypothetical protein
MLKIIIPGTEFYNERKEEFVYTKPTALTLEHSLLSLSKWESKWRKPFLGSDNKTIDECIDYVRCMTQEDGIDPLIYQNLSEALFKQINDYIEAPMTATTIRETFGRKGSRQIITNELIYYWMTALAIPFECEKWHLNRLLMLIRVCNEKNAPQKKMSKRDIYSQNRALNAARKSKLGTHG